MENYTIINSTDYLRYYSTISTTFSRLVLGQHAGLCDGGISVGINLSGGAGILEKTEATVNSILDWMRNSHSRDITWTADRCRVTCLNIWIGLLLYPLCWHMSD